ASLAPYANSDRVTRSRSILAPMLTRATLVPNGFAATPSQNSEYGNAHGRTGVVVSSTPMPGTITTSYLRTHANVRNGSSSLPRIFIAAPASPVVEPACASYHCIDVAGAP